MPECHGKEILNDVDIFWEWYQSPRFYSDLRNLLRETSDHGSDISVRIDRRQLLVSGDSAGGFLAAYSWLSQPYLRIKALYLQYPMLHAYTRHAVEPYRGKVISETEVQEFAELYCDHIMDLKALGKLTPRTDSTPPDGMDMAYILSSAKKEVVMAGQRLKISYWEWWFREPDILDRLETIANRHDDASQEPKDPGHVAAPRMAHRSERGSDGGTDGSTEVPHFYLPTANHPLPSYCPPVFITHGMLDTNCPYEDTLRFAALVKRLFPDACIRLVLRADQPHGFDYALDELDRENRWLLQLCMAVGSAWVPEDACETSAIGSCKESISVASTMESDDPLTRSEDDEYEQHAA